MKRQEWSHTQWYPSIPRDSIAGQVGRAGQSGGVPSRGHRTFKGTVIGWVQVVALPQATRSSVFFQGMRHLLPPGLLQASLHRPHLPSPEQESFLLHPICSSTAVRTDTGIWQLKLQRPCCARLWHQGSATCQYTFPAGPNCRAYAYCRLPW